MKQGLPASLLSLYRLLVSILTHIARHRSVLWPTSLISSFAVVMMDDKKVQATADFIEDTTPRDNGRLLGQEKDNALGTRAETSLRPIQAVKYYPKAIAWCLTISMATIMESYDLVLINSFIAFPQFEKKYGVQLPDGSYSIPSEWQMGLTMALVVGMIPGVFANGWLVDRFGYRRVMLLTHMALICCICGTFFAPSVEILLVGCLLM